MATYGGIQRYGKGESRVPHANPKPGFVDKVSGVVPGYTGYVPSAKNTHGVSHYGNIAGGHHNLSAAGPQSGHGSAIKGDRCIEVGQNVKSGYSGHIPRSRDTFGGAHYGVGSYESPDIYNAENAAEGTGTKMGDMRLIHGSNAGNSEYANDGDGGFYGAENHLAEFHNYATDDEPPPSMVAGANANKIAGMQGIGKKEGLLSY